MKKKQKKKVCMVVQNPMVKGGIAAVVNGYRGSQLEEDFNIIYVESYKDGSKLAKLFKAIYGYFHFLKVLLIDKPDLVHIHSSFGPDFYRSLPFIYMASCSKVPIINHIHGAEFETFYQNASDKKKRLVRKVYGKCAILIALSQEWKENLSKIVQIDHITVIENYSIIHDYIVRDKCNKQILFLGTIGHRKGCYDIPTVVKKVINKVPDCKFVIAGDGDIQQIETLLKEKGVDKNVAFPGWVREVQKEKLLRESDIFFLPSYNEGMPMSILDAMGYGLPVISTNVGGIPKIVHDGENGFLFEPGDVDGFANSIIELLNDNEKLRKFSMNSYIIARSKYSLETHIKKVEMLYMKL